HGTGVASKIPGIVMCGKTGTAQVHGEDNSVFVAFAPRDHPRIAIAVVVENSGEGAKWAAPIASFIVEKYLRDSISVRASGITPEQFINANRLPDLGSYEPKLKAKPAPKDSVKKAKTDSANKKARLKLPVRKEKKGTPPQLIAARMERKDDE
ncbi:MAG: penicillin-binding transpeptidase domain-containing protein, partial [Mucilaginibacter sp.]